MADIIYNRFRYNIGKKLVDLSADSIKIALVKSTYTPLTTHNVWADVSANEDSGANYTAGGKVLANKTFVEDDGLNNAKFDADDPVWSTVTLTDTRYAVIYDDTLAQKDLICCLDFGSNQVMTATDFTVVFNSLGIVTI